MSACCANPTNTPVPCPSCGTTGPSVTARTVRPHHPHAADGPWQHCQNLDCHVVYYHDREIVDDRAVISQVGHKATHKPTPVCFCFAHTAADLAADAAEHDGVSTIKAEIKDAVAAGQCACEHLNPTGKCCLAAVHRALTAPAAPAVAATGA